MSQVYNSGKIIICTPSNKAVDEIVSRLSLKGLYKGHLSDEDLLRVGSIDYNPSEDIKKHSLM